MRNCCPTCFERSSRRDYYKRSSSSSTISYGSMQGNNNMNTSSLACKVKARKSSEVSENW